jgi:hypothetical protein
MTAADLLVDLADRNERKEASHQRKRRFGRFGNLAARPVVPHPAWVKYTDRVVE